VIKLSSVKKELHPSIAKFKTFVKDHPKLVEEVRKQKRSWQEIYEDWYLFGEDDQTWAKYRSTDGDEEPAKEDEKKAKGDFLGSIFSSVKNMDVDQMQQHMTSMNSAISNIQQVLQQFQTKKPIGGGSVPNNPFGFRKD